MRKIIFLISFLITSICATAQMDANWLWGDSLGIKFSSGTIIPIESSIKTVESAASISDSSGNLLFYSDGQHVYNKLNQLMDNGDSLINGQLNSGGNTITNGTIIIPFPDNINLYLLFHLNSLQNNFPGLYYSIIDISLNGGLGEVTLKNQALINFPTDSLHLTEKIAITRHANGRDWWIVIHKLWTNEFIKFLATPSGINGPYYQSSGRIMNVSFLGEMIFNNEGNQLVNVGPTGLIDLFDFDRCTGELSNYKNLGSTIYPDNVDTNYFYGAAFSPDDSKIYVAASGKGIIQFSNFSFSDTSLNYIKKWIVFHQTSIEINYGQLELAPNGKIYITRFVSDTTGYGFDSINEFLAEIAFPNLDFPFCQYNLFGQWLFNESLNFSYASSLSYSPNYNLGALDGSACDTLGLEVKEIMNKKNEVNIYPNPACDKIMIKSFDIESITVFNLLGQQKIKHNYKNEKEIELHLNNLSSGIYIVEIETANRVFREKFIKE